MASLESKAFNVFLKLINKKSFLKKQFDFGKFDFYQHPRPPKELYKLCNIESRKVANRNVYTLRPKCKSSGKHILYLHGGAYVQNFVKQHWTFLGLLITSTHCTITAPDYPLAPSHSYKDVFAMMEPLYNELARSAPPAGVIVMGDSSGGGMALSLAQLTKKYNGRMPSKLILLSPWLDISLQNPAIQAIDPLDPFLGIDGLRQAGRSYADGTAADYFLLSPIHGPTDGLPDIHLFVGTRDILVADARKFKSLMEQNANPIHYHEYEEMVHTWMLLNFPESKMARAQIISIIEDTSQARH